MAAPLIRHLVKLSFNHNPAVLSFSRSKCFLADINKFVDSEDVDGVCVIGINRPDKRNAVSRSVARQLNEAFEEFEENDRQPVAVLHGKGGHFCAGYDLAELSEAGEAVDVSKFYGDLTEGSGPLGPTKRIFNKPVIAAISGCAVAGGLELALMCDLRVVEEDATMGVFCRRFGVPLLDGGSVRLPHLIGLSRALDLILTGRAVDAQEARQIGLANYVVPTGTALDHALSLAKQLSRFPQECLRSDRLSAYHASFNTWSVEEAFEFELRNAEHVISLESTKGATKFTQGSGRGGSFDMNYEPACT